MGIDYDFPYGQGFDGIYEVEVGFRIDNCIFKTHFFNNQFILFHYNPVKIVISYFQCESLCTK